MTRTRQLTVALILGLAGLAPLATAHSNASGAVKARMDQMETISAATKTLGLMLRSGQIDQIVAEHAIQTLVDEGAHMPMLFEPEDLSAPTEALPAIWENFDDFIARAGQLSEAARLMGEALPDPAATQAAFTRLGKTCQGCHAAYRIDRN